MTRAFPGLESYAQAIASKAAFNMYPIKFPSVYLLMNAITRREGLCSRLRFLYISASVTQSWGMFGVVLIRGNQAISNSTTVTAVTVNR